jgi:hypothetical protein
MLNPFFLNAESQPCRHCCALLDQDFVDGRLAAGEMGAGIKLENMVPKVIRTIHCTSV